MKLLNVTIWLFGSVFICILFIYTLLYTIDPPVTHCDINGSCHNSASPMYCVVSRHQTGTSRRELLFWIRYEFDDVISKFCSRTPGQMPEVRTWLRTLFQTVKGVNQSAIWDAIITPCSLSASVGSHCSDVTRSRLMSTRVSGPSTWQHFRVDRSALSGMAQTGNEQTNYRPPRGPAPRLSGPYISSVFSPDADDTLKPSVVIN